MKSNNKIAIILVNYKTYADRFLDECYASLQKQDYKDFDLFIADNATSKESLDSIVKLAPDATIVKNRDNLGWAGGNNSVIKKYLSDYENFILLNMDTVLDPSWLSELMETADKENLQVIQSKILIHGKETINSFGNRINYLGYGYCNAFGLPKDTVYKPEIWPMDYASGASMLIKREVFKKIGFLREEFFMYHDDLEFCVRARLAGYNIGFAENSICFHKYQFGSTLNLMYFMERNRLITLFSTVRWRTLILIFPMLFCFQFAMLIYMATRGKFVDELRAMGYIFTPAGNKLISNIRREIKTYRVKNDYEIIKNYSGKVIFPEIDNWILRNLANPVLSLYWQLVRRIISW